MPTSTRASSRAKASFGSVRKLPSGRYQVRYSVPGAYDRRKAPVTFPTKRAAEDWLAATRADMLRGVWTDPLARSMTFHAYATQWLACRVDLAPRTAELYDGVLRRYVAAALTDPSGVTVDLGATELAHLDLPTVRRWYAAVAAATERSAAASARRDRRDPARVWAQSETGAAILTTAGVPPVRPTGRLSPAVTAAWRAAGSPAPATPEGTSGRARAAQAYRLVRTICNAAVADGLLTANPCRVPRAGQARAAERPIATRAQIHTLADAMPDHLAAAIHLAAWSGLRAGELFALDRSRVNLDAACVRVDRSRLVLRGKVCGYGPPKTAAGQRTVHLPPHVVALLREHIATHVGPAPDALLFTCPRTGSPITESMRHRAFGVARKAAGVPGLRWHDLRHTGATFAARAGATTSELQHRMGHATAAAAMIYQHATAERDRALAARMAQEVTR